MATTAIGTSLTNIPLRKRRGLKGLAWRIGTSMRRIFHRPTADENSVEAPTAVAYFLGEMLSAAGRTYPVWNKLLDDALGECTLGFDERRALLEVHPLDDYYFAGVVALECARMRGHYSPMESTEILGEVGDQVDAVAGRQDRIVSDLVFYILGKIELGAGVDRMKAPHDKVVKGLLQHIGVQHVDSTQTLLRDKALRHLLGEPLALGVPQWWKAFHTQFTLYWPPREPEPELTEDDLAALASPAPEQPLRARRRRRRAVAF